MRPGKRVISLISVALFMSVSRATSPAPTPTPAPMPPSMVQGVTVTRTVSPALRVSWSAVSGSNITYTVCYVNATTNPSYYAHTHTNCETSGITGTSTTLSPLSGGTTYKIWVKAVSSGGQGPYSYGGQYRTFQVEHIKTNARLDPGADASNDGLSAGLFIAGLFSGVLALLLVEGIIWGAWKIRPNQKLAKSSEEGPGINNIQMTDCPAYVSNGREDKRTVEHHYDEVNLGQLRSTKTE